MNMKKKSIAMLGFSLALTCCLGTGVAITAFADEEQPSTPPLTATNWFKAPEDGEGLPASWTDNGDGTLTNTNNQFLGNLLLTTNENLVGDYSVEATFTGSKNTEVTDDINFGIVPWFQDKANYAIIYLQWRAADKFNLINVQTIAFENGVQTPWADHWLDHLYPDTLYQLNPTDSITVHVDKTLNATATADTYRVIISADKNGSAISESPAMIDFTVSAPKAAAQAMAGVYSWNDTVTVSDFKAESLTQTGVYKNVSDDLGTTGRSTSADGWRYSAGTYSVNASAGNSLQNQAVLQNEQKNNYQVSYTASCEDGASNQLSVVPLYRDEKNYIRFVINQTETGATVTVDGKSEGEAISQDAVEYIGSINWTSVQFAAGKRGTTFILTINNDEAHAIIYQNADFISSANIAIGAGNCSADFSNITIEELQYVPYDWLVFGDGWFVSSKTEESVTITEGEDGDEGKYAMTLTSVAEETEWTRLYKASGMYNEVSASAKFTAEEGASYGLYISFTDKENYVAALVGNGKVSLVSVAEGVESVVAETDLVLTDINILKVTAKFAAISVEMNGSEVLTGEVASLAETETGNVGVAAIGGVVGVVDFVIDGFWPNRDRTEGVWNLRGRRIGTWTIGDTAITADAMHGTDFLNTIATTRATYSPADGYYVAAAITITELYGGEWKTGVMPYYKDANNNIFVWLSQWSGGATMIVMRGMLNGRVVGAEWRETAVAYTMKDAVNYLEIYVHGDGIYVYLNKSFAPVVTTSFEGLSAMPTASYGLTVLNTSATFAQLSTSDSRIFTETGTPTIEKVGGTMPTKGQVGTEIRIPVFSATGVGGATAEITLTVSDPDGQEVEVKSNKFTPEKNGEYTVMVKATDAWGNADTQTYTITVTGGAGSKVGLIVGLSVGGVVLVAGIAVGVVFFLKKRKKL